MDKKKLIQDAEQFITKDLLYGFYNGRIFKDFIEYNADRIVSADDSQDIVIMKIKDLAEEPQNGDIFYPASSIEPVLDFNLSDEELINTFIKQLTYIGDIKTSPNTSINIVEELKQYINKRNEDNTFGVFHKSLSDIYRVLLSNEYRVPTRIEKLEQIIRIINDLKEVKEDYEEISKSQINGITFIEMMMNLPYQMDDMFKVDGIDLDEYITKKYEEYSLYRYNSVENKPTNVEVIKLTEDAKDVTSEYIFLSPEESSSLIKYSKEDLTNRSSLIRTILNIIRGIDLAMSPKTLHAYGERITLTRDSINANQEYKEDHLINELYQAMIYRYAKKDDQLDLVDTNWDDFEVLFRTDLNDIKEKVNNLHDEFFHTYTPIDDEIRNVEYDLKDLKGRIEQMGVSSMHHELDEVYEKIKKLKVVINYSRDSVSHEMIRSQDDIEHLEMMRDLEARKTAVTIPERAAIELRVEKMDKDIKKKLEDDLQAGKITQEFYNKHTGNDSYVKA